MPDYNPDKEAHRTHKWIVHKATLRGNFHNVVAADKVMPFDHEGRFSVNDEGVANEIRKAYPREVTVSRVSASHASDRGHKYFFSCPKMPWHEEKIMFDPEEKPEELPNTSAPDHDFDSADLDSPQG